MGSLYRGKNKIAFSINAFNSYSICIQNRRFVSINNVSCVTTLSSEESLDILLLQASKISLALH